MLSGCAATRRPSSAPPTTASTTTVRSTTTTLVNLDTEATLKAAAVAYLGVPLQDYVLTAQISTVDPTWGMFYVVPSAADEGTFQAAHGVADYTGGMWHVLGFGGACVMLPTTPPAVVDEFEPFCNG
jgi:hypothetical protein